MKVLKILAILVGVYVLSVAVFELRIGIVQPDLGNTLIITTRDGEGRAEERVLTRRPVDGRLYVSAHHWPRAWYRRALVNPDVEITVEGVKKPYRAVEVNGEEYDHVADVHPLPLVARILQGFAPRRIVRLDPR